MPAKRTKLPSLPVEILISRQHVMYIFISQQHDTCEFRHTQTSRNLVAYSFSLSFSLSRFSLVCTYSVSPELREQRNEFLRKEKPRPHDFDARKRSEMNRSNNMSENGVNVCVFCFLDSPIHIFYPRAVPTVACV